MSQQVAQLQNKTKTIGRTITRAPIRLWVRAKFVGFRRSKVQQNENQAILKLEGVQDRSASRYYFGKRVVSVTKSGNSFKTSWGRISRSHGNNGAVLARFSKNLAPRTIGSTLRVMLFPQRHH